jgi:hypothetical protein
MSGSPHPTENIDILEPVKFEDADFLEGTKAVTEQQDVEKSVSPQKGETGTWTQNNNAAPVTSAAVDPDKNPIRELLVNDYDGFIPAYKVESAVQQFKNSQ